MFDGVNLGECLARPITHQHMLMLPMIDVYRLGSAREEIDRYDTAQLEMRGRDLAQLARYTADIDPERETLTTQLLRAQAMNIKKVKFCRKRKVFLQQAIGRMCAWRLWQYGMVCVKAHALAGTGRQPTRARIIALNIDTPNARCQTFVERRYRSPVTRKMNAQGIDLKLGKINAILRYYADQETTFIINLCFVNRQGPQRQIPCRAEANFFAAIGIGHECGVTRNLQACSHLALGLIECHLHDHHRRYGGEQRRAEIFEQRAGDLRKFSLNVTPYPA